MPTLASELESIVCSVPTKFDSLSHVDDKPNPSKWSKKEILGHLCDSASVNHKRFVDILISKEPITLYKTSINYITKKGAYIRSTFFGYSLQSAIFLYSNPFDSHLLKE
ncbi:hypothetical protein AB1283_02885 [Bacillus sp. S13(2024)]|uniref:hypothetical protein n=1 Tax=unclassified Bacillus (in: firmicutes) TaxID=185979 RepID=UPI003D2532B3